MVLIVWSIVRVCLFLYAYAMDISEITRDGIIMIQGFHVSENMPLLALVPWATIVIELFVVLLGVAADLIAGIMGVAYWKKPERANRCLLWGIFAIGMSIVAMIVLGFAAGIVSFAMHIVYIAGAYELKNEKRGPSDG